ncbi:3-methyl-2-oxobutanoate hydroxymethyltransferase [Tissierella sp. Yu-01]|uniref:3-methyl-2-oxobutanoate hydroxymethyltransferase n=1 Tax=Tissierella sp. Yu-01 TaxID=3035694 RepID=UPI00240D2A67|nr:3-methyl-2-oxobutanoate hydroxymethyltransferase [Tissierella sp. Yu-01]WFA08656.1 3-methyl-2-oxobutanoate hydroxymethyltransferase [Tissierella sp. Yu-01]
MTKKKPTIQQLKDMKVNGEKFKMITVYDYQMASIVDKSDIELILVGDSLGMIIQGHEGTTPVNIEDIEYHLKAVRKGAPNTFIVGDMPFMAYQVCKEDAIRNAGSLIKLGADCVKMEGGLAIMDKIKAVTDIGIPVVAHIGLTPQTASSMGGFKVQGKNVIDSERLLKEAIAAEEAGAFAIVLECIPTQLANLIEETISIPTIGCGAGPKTTAQNLNAYDLLGIFDAFIPKFVKRYANMGQEMVNAMNKWSKEIDEGIFPESEHEFNMKVEALPKIDK